MEKVEFLDSTGLGVLVGGLKKVRAHDGSLDLVCTQERLLKIFRITGLAKVFASTTPPRPRSPHCADTTPLTPTPARASACSYADPSALRRHLTCLLDPGARSLRRLPRQSKS